MGNPAGWVLNGSRRAGGAETFRERGIGESENDGTRRGRNEAESRGKERDTSIGRIQRKRIVRARGHTRTQARMCHGLEVFHHLLLLLLHILLLFSALCSRKFGLPRSLPRPGLSGCLLFSRLFLRQLLSERANEPRTTREDRFARGNRETPVLLNDYGERVSF